MIPVARSARTSLTKQAAARGRTQKSVDSVRCVEETCAKRYTAPSATQRPELHCAQRYTARSVEQCAPLYSPPLLALHSAQHFTAPSTTPVPHTHLRAHETRHDLVCRLLPEKKKRPLRFISSPTHARPPRIRVTILCTPPRFPLFPFTPLRTSH